MTNARHGALLVTVLLASTVVWVLLGTLLIALRFQYEVALVARDQRLARDAATQLIEGLRTHDWWSGEPLEPDRVAGGSSTCSWLVTPLGHDDRRAEYGVEVTLGRSRLFIEATAHRPSPLR